MPTAVRPAHPARRTQAERTASTRTALLDATTECLAELGHSRTTTPEVVRRAGVSQGALFRHFPTKDGLLAATADHIYDDLLVRWTVRVAAAAPSAAPAEARITGALDLLWEMFLAPEFGAALELSMAARTDATLRARLDPVLARHARRMRDVAAELFPATASDPAAVATVDLVLETFLGLAVSRGAGHDPDHEARVRSHLVTLARTTLARAAPTHPTPRG